MNNNIVSENDKKEIEEFFEKQFENVNKWLSFAEAKNAALIAFNIAMLKIINDLYKVSHIASIIMMILIIVSLCISLKSFIPNLSKKVEQMDKNKVDGNFKDVNDVENLIFYRNIAQINKKEILLEMVRNKYFPDVDKSYLDSPYLLDLSEEIVINSKITLKKYNAFSNALHLDLVAVILILIIFFCK